MNEDFLKYLHKTEDGEMNNERKAYRPNKNRIRETVETDETDDLNDKVEFLKERLYKKIDACFIQFGLRGLTKIDESIADGLTEFIHSEREPNRVIRPRQTKRPIEIEEEDDTEDNTEVNFYDADSIISMASQIDIGDAQDYADTSVKKVKRIADVTPVTKKKKPANIKKESSVVTPDDFGGMDLDSIGDAIEE